MTTRQKTWIAAGTLLLLLAAGGIGWAMSRREDPQVTKVRELQAKAFSPDTDHEKRRALFDKMRAEGEKLTEEQRDNLRSEMRNKGKLAMKKRVEAYFALDEEARIAYLDEQIDEMEKRRKEWEKRAKERRDNGEDKERRGRGDGERAGRPGGGGPGGGGPGGRRGEGTKTAEQRNERRRGFLSHTSATERAKFVAFFEDLKERREERGLPPMRGPGGGRGPGKR